MRTILSQYEEYIKTRAEFVNLDNAEGLGTHWVVYTKRRIVIYFNSFGNLRPLRALMQYPDMTNIEYNRTHALSTLRSKQLWTIVFAVFMDN